MVKYCPKCGVQLVDGAKFCSHCGSEINRDQAISQSDKKYIDQHQNIQSSPNSGIWYQDYYKIRKKVVTVGQKYWIEDSNNNLLGFCKQKMFRLKEDIRIYTDESQNQELFCIKQKQILDAFGNFGIIDSKTGNLLGSIKREWVSSAFFKDKWEIYDPKNQQIGIIEEKSAGQALARKYMPGGGLIPETMNLQHNGQVVASINQSFKIIGDIWEMNCIKMPPNFDRRVLIGTMLLMGLIERRHK